MKNETMYFNDLLSIWLEKQKQARALSTYVKYRHLADRYISPYFRAIQLSEVDLPMLQTFRNSLLSPDSLHPLGNGTIRCILLLVNSILRLSYETGQTNGILYLPPRLPKKRPEVPVFTLQEQEQLEHYLTAIQESPKPSSIWDSIQGCGLENSAPCVGKIFIFPIAISMSDTRYSA